MPGFLSSCLDNGSWFLQVLDINKKVFGDEHPTTLTAMANLATLFAARGLHLDAEQLGRKVGRTVIMLLDRLMISVVFLVSVDHTCFVVLAGIGSLHTGFWE